jgi:hypothetical protein
VGDLAQRDIGIPACSSAPGASREEAGRNAYITVLLTRLGAILRKLIAGYDKSVVTPDAEALSGLFGRKKKKRTEQIEGILETLTGLGQL